MEWTAKILNVSDLSSDGTVTISFDLLLDGEPKARMTVVSDPEHATAEIASKSAQFRSAYVAYVSDSVPQVGQTITV